MDWHERYALNPRPFGDAPTPFLRNVFEKREAFRIPSGKLRILCPGDGYGRNGLWLAQRGHSVIGFDLVPSAVRNALTAAIQADADYVSIPADVSGSPFPLSGDAVFDVVATVWMRLPQEQMRREWNAACTRHLREGGVIVFVGGRGVTDAETEQAEWPASVSWDDFSSETEVRLIGRKEALTQAAEGT